VAEILIYINSNKTCYKNIDAYVLYYKRIKSENTEKHCIAAD